MTKTFHFCGSDGNARCYKAGLDTSGVKVSFGLVTIDEPEPQLLAAARVALGLPTTSEVVEFSQHRKPTKGTSDAHA